MNGLNSQDGEVNGRLCQLGVTRHKEGRKATVALEQCISVLGRWDGYELCRWRQERRGDRAILIVRVSC